MTYKVQQTWWHIEEIFSPFQARKIRQVMDIFTSEPEIPIPIGSNFFVGMRIIARNLNREIAFLEDKEKNRIIMNLDPLDSFPLAPTNFIDLEKPCLFSWGAIPGNDDKRLKDFLKQDYNIDWVETAKIDKIDNNKTIKVSTDKNFLSLRLINNITKVKLIIDDDRTNEFIVKKKDDELDIYKIPNETFYHIKIEFEYVDTKPLINDVPLFDNNRFHLFEKRSEVKINGHIQPEVYIYLPLGRRLTGNSFSREIIPLGENREGYNIGMQCIINKDPEKNVIHLIGNNQPDAIKIEFDKPFINSKQKKRIYNYTIEEESFRELNQSVKNIEERAISYSLIFTSKFDIKILFISIIPILFCLFSIFIIISKLNITNHSILENSNNSMPFLIIIMSALFFYYSLIKDGYDLPFKRYYIIIFMIYIIAFALWALF